MTSVTQRIKQIKQPYGGYVKPSDFEKIEFNDGNTLGEENIHASLVGLAVDYMTRFCLGTPIEEAFSISLMGARIIRDEKNANSLLKNIDSLNSKSIFYACKLVGYDVCFRAGPMYYKNVSEINADESTINNIMIMVSRSLAFFQKYGPIKKDGFTFEGAYTRTINSGDGDFLTEDTLWDFKVSSSSPTPAYTLQLMVYYIMGFRSIHPEFKSIKNIGIFNPKLNVVYIKKLDDIPDEVFKEIATNIIGYSDDQEQNVVEIDKYYSRKMEMTEIMDRLGCSRYRVMKLYNEQGLPLQKENNKYYTTPEELEAWIEEQIRLEEERKKYVLIILAIMMFLFIMIMIFQ